MKKKTPVREARKLIAVNLDQTLSDTLGCLVEWHNHTYCTKLKVADFHTLDYWKVWGGTREESCQKIREFYNSEHFDSLKPIDDYALETLKAFKRRHFKLVVVTSRQQFIAEKTQKFLDRYYPGIFSRIYFCNLYLLEKEKQKYISKPKHIICEEIKADVLIDDSLENAFGYCHLDIDLVLYDKQKSYKWNHQQELPHNVRRAYDWKQIMSHFPKPTSPLKHCITDLDHEDCSPYEILEIELLPEDEDEFYFMWSNTNSVCV